MKIILFDADGVLTVPEDYFTVMYTRERGFDARPFSEFFRTEWADFVTGKRDLKIHIRDNPSLWRWDGTPDELIAYWCRSEDIRNEEMIELVKEIGAAGTPCYLATEQEKYRGEYMKNVMFKSLFDDYFVTADIGFKKSDSRFFEVIIERLSNSYETIRPEDILFFDDSQSKVEAARRARIDARLYTNPDDVIEILQHKDVPGV